MIGALVAAFWFGQSVPFAEQWPLFEALRTTASIIFAVVGAWLAIIYPERLKLTFRADSTPGTTESTVKMGQLLHPAMHSTAILCVVLLVGITAPILKQVPYLLENREVFRGFAYLLAMALTFWQIWTVVLTLVPADVIKTAADRERQHRATVQAYRSSNSQGRPGP